jgi:hypothetical protein
MNEHECRSGPAWTGLCNEASSRRVRFDGTGVMPDYGRRTPCLAYNIKGTSPELLSPFSHTHSLIMGLAMWLAVLASVVIQVVAGTIPSKIYGVNLGSWWVFG